MFIPLIDCIIIKNNAHVMVTCDNKYRILCCCRGFEAVEKIVQCFVIIAESSEILIQNLTIMLCKTLLSNRKNRAKEEVLSPLGTQKVDDLSSSSQLSSAVSLMVYLTYLTTAWKRYSS